MKVNIRYTVDLEEVLEEKHKLNKLLTHWNTN